MAENMDISCSMQANLLFEAFHFQSFSQRVAWSVTEGGDTLPGGERKRLPVVALVLRFGNVLPGFEPGCEMNNVRILTYAGKLSACEPYLLRHHFGVDGEEVPARAKKRDS